HRYLHSFPTHALPISLLDAAVTSSLDPVQVGARLPNVARNSANLWTRYDVTAGALHGLGIGVGLVYTGERSGMLQCTRCDIVARSEEHTSELQSPYDL